MGSSKGSSSGSGTTVVNQTTTPTATPEERELNALYLAREKYLDPQIRDVQSSGLNLANMLLTGYEPLPGYLQQLSQGISPEVTSSIVQQSLEDIRPGFQGAGVWDSGVRAELEARTAADIRRASEEYNIGNRLNLLNLALSGQAQVQQPTLGYANILSSNLQGLRSINTSGTTSTTSNTTSKFSEPLYKQIMGWSNAAQSVMKTGGQAAALFG